MRCLLVAAGLALGGCSAKAPRASVVPPSGLGAAAFPEPRPERDGFVPRRRLEHSITLGHDAFLPGERSVPAAPIAPVTIQNNITVAPPASAWGSYGYGFGYGRGYYQAPVVRQAPSASTPPVGGDWPRAPDSGPRPMR